MTHIGLWVVAFFEVHPTIDGSGGGKGKRGDSLLSLRDAKSGLCHRISPSQEVIESAQPSPGTSILNPNAVAE